LQLAEELALPVIIHNRQADADIAAALGSGRVPGVLHCFSSDDRDYLERMLEAGYCVSFAGPLTFKNAPALRGSAAVVPLDRLLIETDCPYLAPSPHRGQRNEPAFLRETATCLARIRGLSLADLAQQLWANTQRVFPALVAA
jgi:TatD DNase family protein